MGRNILHPFLVVVVVCHLLSCKRMVRSNALVGKQQSAFADSVKSSRALQLKTEAIEEERLDSLTQITTLKGLLDFSSAKIADGQTYFIKEFELPASDSTVRVIVMLAYGNLFSSSARHLMVRQMLPSGVYWNVFSYSKRQFTPLLSHMEYLTGYVGDTVQDVNGDKTRDLLVQRYPSAGCCLRNIFDVYLYLPGSDTFKGPYSFINPTFYAKEGVVRGVGYGMPGNTALYKYKWNGLQLDTIEYIYHNADDTLQHSFYSTKQRIEEENVIKRRLKSLPAEYRSITDFDWFEE